ncbi:MAG: ABC transporter ATP-binding protein [Nitrososphaerota archaeon]|jgi:putative ABC transport system ATP-binding protein|nr:ABC transporter ATP-binding protein [Nitrososphaerota archaeon]
MVEVRGLAREYRHGDFPVAALNGVDLAVRRSEIVGVVGPSGSGKSTLLNMIGGIDRPSRGSIVVDGIELGRLDERRLAEYRLKKVGFIFQFYNLIPTLSALENVELPLSLAGMDKRKRIERARSLLERVGLEARLDHTPDQLSGGEQQRVSVARALSNDPAVILGDEPTGDLDSKSAEALMELIVSLRDEQKTTFVLVTHDPIVVARCDRSLSLRDGRVVREIPKGEGSRFADSQRATMDGLY